MCMYTSLSLSLYIYIYIYIAALQAHVPAARCFVPPLARARHAVEQRRRCKALDADGGARQHPGP